MWACETDHNTCGLRCRCDGALRGALLALALLTTLYVRPAAVQAQAAGANTPASASQPAAIVVPGDVRYCNQQSIQIRYRWTGAAPKGVQMWISLDATQWLPWAWSDKPAEPFSFAPPRQGKILIALAPAPRETAVLPDSGYQSLAIVFDWDKPLVRLISSQVHASAGGVALRLAWAAWDENLGERPISLHWRHTAEEPWQLGIGDLPNSAACEWPIPAPLAGKSFEVCLRATDQAGNAGEVAFPVSVKAKTPEPVPPPAATSQAAPQLPTQADPAVPTAAAGEAERLCQIAQQHMMQNEFDMAEDMFREAVETDPTYYAARLNLGILLQRRGRHAEAIGEYQAVVTLKPDNVTAWRNLALAYMTTKDYPKARVTLQKLLAVEADNPQSWIDLGDVEMLMGRSQSARQCWEKGKSLSKPGSDTHTRAGKRLSVYVRDK
jgi:tetratricopeptide (TPR) repeat protein